MSITYTSTDAKFDNTFSSHFWGEVTSGMDIPDLPNSQIAVRGGFVSNQGWFGDITLYSYGNTCSVADCSLGTEIESYTVIDLSLSKQLNKKIDFYMTVENIIDEKDIVSRAPKNGARAQKPRTLVLGFRFKI